RPNKPLASLRISGQDGHSKSHLQSRNSHKTISTIFDPFLVDLLRFSLFPPKFGYSQLEAPPPSGVIEAVSLLLFLSIASHSHFSSRHWSCLFVVFFVALQL